MLRKVLAGSVISYHIIERTSLMLHRGLLDHHTHRAITMYVGGPCTAKGKVQPTCCLDQRKSSTETWLGHRRGGVGRRLRT